LLGTPPPYSQPKIFIRPNAYEPGRANITIFDWSHASSLSVDLSSVLSVGDSYEIRNAQNFFGAAVKTGIYGGGAISLPMTGLAPAAPVGWTTPPSTGPEFNVFVVRRVSSSTTTTTTAAAVPDPHFSIRPNPAPVNTSVQLIDTSLNKPTSWLWNFGDPNSASNTSTVQSPTHVFVTTGAHTVRLTVTNSAGSATTTNTISVY
jgi:PKD repeat protein